MDEARFLERITFDPKISRSSEGVGLQWSTSSACSLPAIPSTRTTDVRRHIRAAGARVLYLPPYSPDLNPSNSPGAT